MMDPGCTTLEEGARSGEQPKERPKRPEMQSERLNVNPKRKEKGRKIDQTRHRLSLASNGNSSNDNSSSNSSHSRSDADVH